MDEQGRETSMSHSSETINVPLKLTYEDYCVGWICALPEEQTAALAMLDEVHPALSRPVNDENAYTLGSIAKHNVVIACLPKGRYATIPAAQVAIWMISTFPYIKIGLMVGVGGGIPPIVRLGHVVVGTPSGEYPGVVQWDTGKTTADGHFERRGSLNSSPTFLLTALTKLESRHDMYGSKIPEHLDDLAERFPGLKAKYAWSDSLKDPLDRPNECKAASDWSWIILSAFKEMFTILLYLFGWLTHGSSDLDSQPMAISKTKIDSLSSKTTRKAHRPQIHYGLIASGNQVIENASFRDRLNEKLGGNVLCIEMGAAGLMHNFPCVVIRGICDYADAQKIKDWQCYAAAVAAGYARELLEVIDPVEVERAPEARMVTRPR